ncbi:hypothetical protein [Streptomyces sp. 1222.5]|uniref:hypothetical protein n=1 Tax=Streptomyces sp. 1222.5 TaxID=1881026 RepID=UPI003D7096DB
MTYHFRDADGHEIETQPEVFDGQPVVTLWARGESATVPVRIPVDRLEEFIAGTRDTARQAASQEQSAPAIATGLAVQPYRTDRGDPAWVFRCWGTDHCDGWLSLDHYSEQSARRARDRHVAEEHQERQP